MSAAYRLKRLFNVSGKCFDVAVDHGFFNEHRFLDGIEDLGGAVESLVAAAPDAIQLTVGQAELLQRIPGRHKPALVLRTDVANCYGVSLPRTLFSRLIGDPVEQALRLDAACVVVNLLLLPGQPELHAQCIENICRLKPACERFGMPLMIEPLVMQANEKGGGYMVDGDLHKIVALVRQARELGADLIKADPCDDATQYHEVVRAAGCPVLVRGGGKAAEREIFARTVELMKQGAQGIVYGRNVIQHPKPAAITRAFMAIVHDGASVERATEIVNKV
ncbi:MAG: aldolase [Planctomycetota bacterium]|nr:aldolase [Planctomycetota bacterium]